MQKINQALCKCRVLLLCPEYGLKLLIFLWKGTQVVKRTVC